MSPGTYYERFSAYFDREVAQKAAAPLSDGAEIGLEIIAGGGESTVSERFTFTRVAGRNRLLPSPAPDPQLVFSLTADAAEAILSDPADEIGPIGVGIARLILSPDGGRGIGLRVRAGFLTLFGKGYFGVVASGGAAFAGYLASKGLNGMGAIKAALRKRG